MKRYQCRDCSCFCTVNIDETWEKVPDRCPFTHRNDLGQKPRFEEVHTVDENKRREPGINEIEPPNTPEVGPFKAGENYMGFHVPFIPDQVFAQEAIDRIEMDNACSCCPITPGQEEVCRNIHCRSCIYSYLRHKDGTVRIEFFKDLLVHNYGWKVSK